MPRLRHLLPSLVALAFVTACGATEAIAPAPIVEPPPPAPTTATLQVDFSYIEVVKDCDGIEGDGDFTFNVRVDLSAGGGGTVYSASRTLGDRGRTPSIGRRTYTVPRADGQQVTIQFTASEGDKNIIGQTYNDSRLNNVSRTSVHLFNNGSWSRTGPQTVTLGSGDCQVRLLYTANAI